MQIDKTRKINREEFETVRAAIWECGMTNCRYEIFDLGGVLLRNDKDGSRRKQWKDEVSNWFYSAIDRELQQKFNPDCTLSGLEMMIWHFWNEIEYWMLRLGIAALDEEQASYYKTRLNHILYKFQKDTASYLTTGTNRMDDSPEPNNLDSRKVNLAGISWENHCASQGNYTFSVEKEECGCCAKAYPRLGAYVT
jgi:hypothetical protein